MWLESLDLVLSRLRDALPSPSFMARIKGVSGSGQQHGSVWWSDKAESLLAGLDAGKEGGLKVQLEGALTYDMAPNWQDQSTQKECDAFDAELGDREKLAEATGSGAHHVSCPNPSPLS
jgi:xylulokinase